MMPTPIPRSVAPAEALVRGIVHPLFYSKSKNKFRPAALLPPPGRTDVSVLRLPYTQEVFCKHHCRGLGISGNIYLGLAVLLAATVADAARQPHADPVTVTASPLDSNNLPVPASVAISTDDPGLPMHADLLYSTPAVKGQPNTALNLAARYLIQRTTFYLDPQPEADDWQGPTLQAIVAA